ncbi:hypothetical protein [Legionella maioricensis]|uniref:hypothetical protein n=1 Tax=Legionella maioricensis TaxID=2896528 RepID=UPI00254221E9|nr:hypothetical protein [Legionella maioricensis]
MMRKFPISRKPLTRLYSDVVASSSHLPPSQVFRAEKKVAPAAIMDSKATTSTHSEEVKGPKFFAQLKLEERKQFAYKKRIRFDYRSNYSAALALPYSKQQLEKKQNNPNSLLEMSEKYVIEHANRRVDLFFYTLIAYYKTGVIPTYGHTDLQHGRGRTIRGYKTITEACHSSFTPSLLDKTIYQNEGGKEKHKSLLSGTHLMDSLNSTVELPPFMNDLDDVLESKCKQKCLEILWEVSLGKINPVEGLTVFLKMMQDVLSDLKQQVQQKNPSPLFQHSFIGKRHINPKLIDLVIKGTLSTTFSNKTKANDDYIQLLLRMTAEEKALCGNEKNKEQLYLKKTLEMQNEILQTKSGANLSPVG